MAVVAKATECSAELEQQEVAALQSGIQAQPVTVVAKATEYSAELGQLAQVVEAIVAQKLLNHLASSMAALQPRVVMLLIPFCH